MKTLMLTTCLALTSAPLMADTGFPDRPAGWEGALWHSKCDPERYTAVVSEDGERILYWLNPTCQTVEGGGQKVKEEPPEEGDDDDDDDDEGGDPCACLPPEDEETVKA